MVKPRFSNIELIGPATSPLSNYMPSFGGRTQLRSQDRILVDNGGSGYRALDIYMSLFLNPVVYKSWDKVATDICSRELQVKPKDESKEAAVIAEFIQGQLLSIGTTASTNPLLPAQGGIDALTRALATAYITGITTVELVWGRDRDGKRVVKYFKPRDARLFRMEYDHDANVTRPRVLTRADTTRGVAIPAHKFLIHRYWSVPNDDEYGCGLGKNLYYPVEWQKQLMTYWLMLVDKTVMPSTVGTYSEEAVAKPEDITKFEEAVRNFGQDSAIVLKPGYKIETIDLRATNADALERLLDKIDSYIESIVAGESATGKEGAGSQAKDEVSRGIGLISAKALSDGICETLNQTLVKWLTWANFGQDAPVPTVWRNFGQDIATEPTTLAEVESVADFIDLLSKLNGMDISLDKAYIETRLGVPLKKPPVKPTSGNQSASMVAKAPAGTVATSAGPAAQERTGTALYDYVPSPAELLGLE